MGNGNRPYVTVGSSVHGRHVDGGEGGIPAVHKSGPVGLSASYFYPLCPSAFFPGPRPATLLPPIGPPLPFLPTRPAIISLSTLAPTQPPGNCNLWQTVPRSMEQFKELFVPADFICFLGDLGKYCPLPIIQIFLGLPRWRCSAA